jgi:nitrate reductase NapAB chaperone NapD
MYSFPGKSVILNDINARWRDTMTGTEALQSVQFATVKGKRVAVINAEDWEALVEWLETVEDISMAREAVRIMKAVGRDRGEADWVEWDQVKDQIK